MSMYISQRNKYHFSNNDGWVFVGGLGIGLFIISLLLVLIGPLNTKYEINKYLETKEMVEATYNQGDVIDYTLNVKVIEVNEWLSSAKSAEKTFGIFSFYRGKLDNLEYIKLEGTP